MCIIGGIVMKNIYLEIKKLEEQIESLPSGSIVKKKIDNRIYYYHRFYKNSKRNEKYVAFDEVDKLKQNIEKRKELLIKLNELKELLPDDANDKHNLKTNILFGKELIDFSKNVSNFKKRDCYYKLDEYIHSENDKVLILYGLRRTGKTTMIRQLFLEMDKDELYKSAFIQINVNNSINELNHDLKQLKSLGYKYIFIDEVTLIKDFIDTASIFSDIYASLGMRIVLSGTDSLSFVFSLDEQLFDRAIMVHTTFISYKEFENVLNIKGIDNYIEYGGTMSLDRANYTSDSLFLNETKTNEYLDSAIANNIQHSLANYKNENHFLSLEELYYNKELTSVINRVIEDINHRFTYEVITKEFKLNDLALANKNLIKDRNYQIDLYSNIDLKNVTSKLIGLLEIKNDYLSYISDVQIKEIEEYLCLLDLIDYVDVININDLTGNKKRVVISQAGLRYSQGKSLINSLIIDPQFNMLSFEDRKYVKDRILDSIKGRMMEDIVLLETKLANKDNNVFVLQFIRGEFDMVVADENNGTCQIYEIKHSKQKNENQYRHLIDEDKLKQTEHRFGKIIDKAVLYRGESTTYNNVKYINVEEYLKNL